MQGWKEPQDSDKYKWTAHVKQKMKHYGLSAQRVVRVIRKPLRIEQGLAETTVAVMQPQSTRRGENGQKTWSSEIWVMYRMVNVSQEQKNVDKMDDKMRDFLSQIAQNDKRIMIISAWRYPGKTKEGESLPDEILEEIAEVL